MKSLFKKSLLVLMVAFIAVFTLSITNKVNAASPATLFTSNLVEGDYVIYYDGRAMSNSVSSSRLTYEDVTVSNGTIPAPTESMIWHIAPQGDYWTIYNAAVGKYAAGTGAKNKAQLLTSGTDNKSLWTVSRSGEGYEFINKANAAAGVNKNLRNNATYGFACYSTSTGGALSLYKINDSSENTEVIDALNGVESFAKLAYKYNKYVETTVTEDSVDVLNNSLVGITDSTYKDWNSLVASSNAVFAGQTAGSNSSIQLRSKNSNSGIITTQSGGKVSKISVQWHSETAAGRTLNVYGSNVSYASPTDLYDKTKQGTLLGTIICGTSTELEIEGDYSYIGLRSDSGAMYLTEISITWAGASQEIDCYSDVDFRIKCGTSIDLVSIENVEGYGVAVTANGETREYNSTSEYYAIDAQCLYTTISLGDVLNNKTRLDVEFTVCAYAVVNGITYYSESVKTYSIVDLVKVYYGMADYKEQVTPLVEVLTSMGYTFE